MSAVQQHELSRLRWRCRRGMRELDVLFSNWLEQHYDGSDPALQAAFARLLECEDDQLWDWMTGRSDPDTNDLLGIVCVLRQADDAHR